MKSDSTTNHKWKKRVSIALIFTAICLLFLRMTAPLIIKNTIIRHMQKHQVRLELQDVDLSLWDMSIRLEELECRPIDQPEALPFFSARTVELQIDGKSIHSDDWYFSNLQIDRPKISLHQSESGSTNVPKKKKREQNIEDSDSEKTTKHRDDSPSPGLNITQASIIDLTISVESKKKDKYSGNAFLSIDEIQLQDFVKSPDRKPVADIIKIDHIQMKGTDHFLSSDIFSAQHITVNQHYSIPESQPDLNVAISNLNFHYALDSKGKTNIKRIRRLLEQFEETEDENEEESKREKDKTVEPKNDSEYSLHQLKIVNSTIQLSAWTGETWEAESATIASLDFVQNSEDSSLSFQCAARMNSTTDSTLSSGPFDRVLSASLTRTPQEERISFSATFSKLPYHAIRWFAWEFEDDTPPDERILSAYISGDLTGAWSDNRLEGKGTVEFSNIALTLAPEQSSSLLDRLRNHDNDDRDPQTRVLAELIAADVSNSPPISFTVNAPMDAPTPFLLYWAFSQAYNQSRLTVASEIAGNKTSTEQPAPEK